MFDQQPFVKEEYPLDQSIVRSDYYHRPSEQFDSDLDIEQSEEEEYVVKMVISQPLSGISP